MLARAVPRAARAAQRRAAASAAAEAAPAAADAADAAAAAPPATRVAAPAPPPPSAEQLARNAALVERLRGKLVLAPLTRGGNLPFRQLCVDFGGGDVPTVGEMAYARHLIRDARKGKGKELALLKAAPNESLFGVQIATKTIDEGVQAGLLAARAGASWVDLNCGCPIYEATRRGLGAVLLRKPAKLGRLAAGIAAALPVPLTVKVRLGESDAKTNVGEVVAALGAAGCAAVTVHGRSMLARYKRPADWVAVGAVAAAQAGAGGLPVIGNGDVLAHYEAARRLAESGCVAVMVGRGALIRPWLFQEVAEGREWAPTAAERVGVYRRLVAHAKAHFGDDARGRSKAWYFIPWHLHWFSRYRPTPEAAFGEASKTLPLLSTRFDLAVAEAGEDADSLPLLERLLRCEFEGAHGPMADALWDARSDGDAVAALEALARERLAGWEAELRAGRDRGDRDGRDEREPEG